MSLDNFKTIENKQAFSVDLEDRKVFEKEIEKSNYGLGISDYIEFVIYDSNDNKLPQGENGELVRYIPLDSDNIRKYFLITETKDNQKENRAPEYIIDTEQLLKEAGYYSGQFKTQVTLLNRRAGRQSPKNEQSAKGFRDKLWVQEVSPSRTEIRVLPFRSKNGENLDLETRYSIFTRDSQFRDDTIYYIKDFIENVKVERILENFLKVKGKVANGETYLNLIKKEFKINDWEGFVKNIREDWVESMNLFVENREWRISNINYKKPLSEPINPELSIKKILEISDAALTEVINKYLPKRQTNEQTSFTREEQITIDEVSRILKTLEEKRDILTTGLEYTSPITRGCTDSNALNYNPIANRDDGTCVYKQDETFETVPPFNPQPTEDEIETGGGFPIPTTTTTFYIWSTVGGYSYIDENGIEKNARGTEYQSFTITFRELLVKTGDVRTTPKIKPQEPDTPPRLTNCEKIRRNVNYEREITIMCDGITYSWIGETWVKQPPQVSGSGGSGGGGGITIETPGTVTDVDNQNNIPNITIDSNLQFL